MAEDVKNIKEATEIGETLSKNLSGYFVSKSHDAKFIFSIGTVIFPTHGRNSSRLIDHRDTYHQETVKAIIMLANALKMEVIAGGVETLKQQVVLEKLGCHLVQGHIFYKPAPAFEFQELLRKYTANSG